ncbi:hypothetical protein ACU686_41335 [Yinghuangia aomiensis]
MGGALENPGLYDTQILDDTWWHALIQYDPSLEQSRTLTRVRQGGLSLREVVDLWADSPCSAPSRAGVAVVGGTDRKPHAGRRRRLAAQEPSPRGGRLRRPVRRPRRAAASTARRPAKPSTASASPSPRAPGANRKPSAAASSSAKRSPPRPAPRQHRRAIRKGKFQPLPAQAALQGGGGPGRPAGPEGPPPQERGAAGRTARSARAVGDPAGARLDGGHARSWPAPSPGTPRRVPHRPTRSGPTAVAAGSAGADSRTRPTCSKAPRCAGRWSARPSSPAFSSRWSSS